MLNFLASPSLPLSLLAAHFVGDFLLQTDWMAINKSKSNKALTIHALVYSLCFIVFGPKFAALTFILHWLTDYCTSRWTSKLWFFKPTGCYYNAGGERYEMWIPFGGNRHWFFVVIGLDQLIHFTALTLTWRYLVG